VGAVHKLTSSDVAELEQKLRVLRADTVDAVRARLGGMGSGQARSLISALGAGDLAVEDMLTENEIALIQHELATLADIDAALKRIAFDIGGICTQCGAPIPIARLRAVPTAATCVDCATVQAAQTGGPERMRWPGSPLR
jgi:RNA polymerase-binding transcription factor DksA